MSPQSQIQRVLQLLFINKIHAIDTQSFDSSQS
jgi:hypothetical protein